MASLEAVGRRISGKHPFRDAIQASSGFSSKHPPHFPLMVRSSKAATAWGDPAKKTLKKTGLILNIIRDKGLEKGKDELLKGKIALEKSLGLGHRPNVIPPGDAIIHGEQRPVEIGWHPVMGVSGKWFAEKTGLGKKITEKTHKYPDPTQHWAVLVGDYCHELWMDEHLDVIYINEKINRAEWQTFEVGRTQFNDEALRQTGETVIEHMREIKPAYNLVSNNCQNFAVLLLDAIQAGAHKEFGTTTAIYKRMTGKGKIKDLFVDETAQQQPGQADQQKVQSPVQLAQQVMDQHTTQLDNHHSFSHES